MPIPQGMLKLEARVADDGRFAERGMPATVTITANGTKVGERKLPRAVPIQLALGEGVNGGMDRGSAIGFTDSLPFAFTGKIDRVAVESN